MIKNFFICLGFISLYNILLFKTGPGLGFSLFLLFLNLCFILFRDHNSKNTGLGYLASGLSILFAFLVSFRANEVIQALNILVSLGLSLVALVFFKDQNTFKYSIPSFLLSPFQAAAAAITSIPRYTEDQKGKESSRSPLVRALFKGLIIAIPVLLVLALILSSADPVFEKLTNNIFKDIQERIIISLLLFVPLFCLSLIKLKEFTELKTEEIKQLLHKGYELSVVLAGIGLLFGAFIAVQFQYLFSNLGERQLEQIGIKSLTYSEYINKGFFELLIASAISIGVISYVLLFIKQLKNQEKTLVQILTSLVIIETFIILLSAAQRINLYQAGHGLTVARIFGMIFLGYLASILLFFLSHVFARFNPKIFFNAVIGLTLLFFLMLNLINVDGIIATSYKPTVNGEIDYYYLSRLSPDAYTVWPEIIADVEKNVENVEAKGKAVDNNDKRHFSYARNELWNLSEKYKRVLNQSRWQEQNLAKLQATQLIVSNQATFNKLIDLDQRIRKIDKEVGSTLYNFTTDRDTSPPLVR